MLHLMGAGESQHSRGVACEGEARSHRCTRSCTIIFLVGLLWKQICGFAGREVSRVGRRKKVEPVGASRHGPVLLSGCSKICISRTREWSTPSFSYE